MTTLRLLLFGSLLLVSPLALAGPKEEEVALTLTRLVISEDAYAKLIDATVVSMSAAMVAPGGAPLIDEGATAKLKLVVKECLPYEEMLRWNAEVYGSRFSVAELQDLISFYQTPTGKKAAALMPEISAEVGTQLGPIMQTRMPAAMKKHGLL